MQINLPWKLIIHYHHVLLQMRIFVLRFLREIINLLTFRKYFEDSLYKFSVLPCSKLLNKVCTKFDPIPQLLIADLSNVPSDLEQHWWSRWFLLVCLHSSHPALSSFVPMKLLFLQRWTQNMHLDHSRTRLWLRMILILEQILLLLEVFPWNHFVDL